MDSELGLNVVLLIILVWTGHLQVGMDVSNQTIKCTKWTAVDSWYSDFVTFSEAPKSDENLRFLIETIIVFILITSN